MKKYIFAASIFALSAFSNFAYAGGNTNNNESNSTSLSSSVSHTGNVQVEVGGSNSNSSNTIVFQSEDKSRNTVKAPAIAPNLSGLVATPATCMGSASVSGGGGGVFSLGIGGTYRDVECEKREALKLAVHLGLHQRAVKIFYSLRAVRNVQNEENTGVNNVNKVSNNYTVNSEKERPTLVRWWFGRK